MKDKRETFRTMIKWTGLVAVAHLIAMIVFGLFMSSSLARFEDNDLIAAAHVRAFWFSVIIEILLCVLYLKISSSFSEHVREVKNAMKEETFSVFSYYKKTLFKEDLLRIAVVFAFQIPFTVFYALAGISYIYTTSFEMFYIMDAGYYAVTGIPIVGLLLGSIVFGVIFFLLRLIFLRKTVKYINKI